jgi:hypothetical protein
MPFNGSGVFQRVRNWVADAAAGIKIRADYHDLEDDGFAAGLSNCIARDGQSLITQNIPFNAKRITGLADPVNDQDAVTKHHLAGPINTGPIVSTGTSRFVDKVLVQSTGRPCFALWNITANAAMGMWIDASQSTLLFGNLDANADPFAYWFGIGSGDGLRCGMQAYKPGGGPWADSSDARVKNVLGDYDTGLDAVAALNPVRFTFKGNDTPTATDLSIHHDVAAKATEFIGLIAQDTEVTMPELVSTKDAFIDGVAVTDLRVLDTTPLIYALINSIKELKARVEALEAG